MGEGGGRKSYFREGLMYTLFELWEEGGVKERAPYTHNNGDELWPQ